VSIEIIAELAQGFEGKPEQARMLLRAAAAAGADAAKFQLVYADELASPDYQHYALFKSLEMGDEVWMDLAQYCKAQKVRLYLDIFGARSLELAERIGTGTVKLHGTDIANLGLLELVARSRVPRVLLGAGGAHQGELDTALKALAAKDVVVLLGFQGYPTPDADNQVARVASLSLALAAHGRRVCVGFADHVAPTSALRDAIPAMALGAGARVLEKHLTLAAVMQLEDHEAALNPDQFAEFVASMRACTAALGHCSSANDFGMAASESAYRAKIRRHVVAGRALEPGATIAPEDLALKRTATADALTDLAQAYGRRLRAAVRPDQAITPDLLQSGQHS
jgi:N,N'-diacetyllegionaminate synthase